MLKIRKVAHKLRSHIRLMRRYTFTLSIKVLEPGLVHIKNAFSPKESEEIVQSIYELGEQGQSGFYRMENERRVLNSEEHRGRMYKAVSELPEVFSETQQRILKAVVAVDPTLHFAKATHAIILDYRTQEIDPYEYIPYHSDSMPVDGTGRDPFMSYTFGDSCIFSITYGPPQVSQKHPKHQPKNEMHRIELKHNDIIVMGGACRYRWHGIYHMYKGKNLPHFFQKRSGRRYAVTLRPTPELIGREEEFQTRSVKELGKINNLYNLKDMLRRR